jgi:class 3 adenylate cyclase
VARFDAALSRAVRVITAAEESYLGDDVLFEHGANLLEGFAALRAAQLQTSPSLLCVVDTTGSGRVGGTLASFERWTQNVGPPQVIDLRDLRLRHGAAAAPPVSRSPGLTALSAADVSASPTPGGSVASPALDAPVVAHRPQRALKTLLFADFAGYSRLHDAFAPLFQQQFLEIGQREIERLTVQPLEAKTWGDALYVVFESPRDGAEFALRFLARMLDVDWTAAGLADTSQIRIALHTGPVFCGFDPVMGRDSHFGASVTRTARIEPVTPPGMVYTSEAFAATLTASGCRGYDLEYIGKLALAKGYGESRIYRLDRR